MQSWVTALVSPRVRPVLKTWKCQDWRCLQNEDGVEITIGTENYLFSLFCMKNYFVWRRPSSRFAVVGVKVPSSIYIYIYICSIYMDRYQRSSMPGEKTFQKYRQDIYIQHWSDSKTGMDNFRHSRHRGVLSRFVKQRHSESHFHARLQNDVDRLRHKRCSLTLTSAQTL